MNRPPPPFESATELRGAHEALLAQLDDRMGPDADDASERSAIVALEPDVLLFVARGSSTGACLEDVRERTSAKVLLDYWRSRLTDAGLPPAGGRLAAFDQASLPDLRDRTCPYVGLESFRSRDSFFGREAETARLVALLRARPLAVVIGASGSGKSSLVMAGALPTLGGVDGWRIAPPLTPGDAVFRALASAVHALAPVDAPHALAEELRADPARIAALLDAGPPVVITIDQFEELFTLGSPDDQAAIAATLAALLASPCGHRAILTLREEFRPQMRKLRALEPWLDGAWFEMMPMGFEELRRAVEQPAAGVNLQFQPGIADELVQRVLGQPAALPLLQFTLVALWEARDRNRITRVVADRVGDPLVALRTAADEFYEGLVPELAAEVKRILTSLVRVNELLEAYRQPVRMSELLRPRVANTREAARRLEEGGYIHVRADASGDDAVVEIRHEALLRNWPRFTDWIVERREEWRRRLALSEAAKSWAGRGSPPEEALLSSWRIEEYGSRDDLTPIERAYVDASLAAKDRRTRSLEEENRRLEELSAGEAALRRRTELELEATRERDAAFRRDTGERDAAYKRRVRLAFGALGVCVVLGLGGGYRYGIWVVDTADRKADAAAQQQELDSREEIIRQATLLVEETTTRLDQTSFDHLATAASATFAEKQIDKPTIDIQYTQVEQRDRADALQEKLAAAGFGAPSTDFTGGESAPDRTEIRYFAKADAPAAEALAELINGYLVGVTDAEARYVRGYPDAVPHALEIWLAADALVATPVAESTIAELTPRPVTRAVAPPVAPPVDPPVDPPADPPVALPVDPPVIPAVVAPFRAEGAVVTISRLAVKGTRVTDRKMDVMIEADVLAAEATRDKPSWDGQFQAKWEEKVYRKMAEGDRWVPKEIWRGDVPADRPLTLRVDVEDHYTNPRDGAEVGEIWVTIHRDAASGVIATCAEKEDVRGIVPTKTGCRASLDHGPRSLTLTIDVQPL